MEKVPYIPNQQDLKLNAKKLMVDNTEMTKMLELSNKDFKAAILKMPQQLEICLK